MAENALVMHLYLYSYAGSLLFTLALIRTSACMSVLC